MVGRFSPTIGVADGQWYRLITNTFLHEPGLSGIGPAHIIFNMWALIVVGPSLERLLGRVRFLTVYLVSGLAGSVLFYLVAPPATLALGASGAIFGLFGAWFVVARRLRLDSRAIVFLIVINLVISFAFSGIAWQAHVGGLVAGAALTAAYAYAPPAEPAADPAGGHGSDRRRAGHRRRRPRSPAGRAARRPSAPPRCPDPRCRNGGCLSSVPPGGEHHAGDDESEPEDQVPVPERLLHRRAALGDVEQCYPRQPEQQAAHHGRSQPARAYLRLR